MPDVRKLPASVTRRLSMLLRSAKSRDAFKRVQCVWLQHKFDLSNVDIAVALGWNERSVREECLIRAAHREFSRRIVETITVSRQLMSMGGSDKIPLNETRFASMGNQSVVTRAPRLAVRIR